MQCIKISFNCSLSRTHLYLLYEKFPWYWNGSQTPLRSCTYHYPCCHHTTHLDAEHVNPFHYLFPSLFHSFHTIFSVITYLILELFAVARERLHGPVRRSLLDLAGRSTLQMTEMLGDSFTITESFPSLQHT